MKPIRTPTAAVIAAYEQTDYFADDQPPVRLRIHDGDIPHRTWLAKHRARSASILTAWNPFGRELSAADNDARQRQLQAAIEASGLPWLPARGEDPSGSWQPEPGFCVFDTPPVLLDRWLVDFEQNAAVRLALGEGCQLVWHPEIRRQI
ncbi:MAG: DUF3293 domain-containing protein [Lautropia sp.]|nr:DUF3293 domain-containing protein [Lautropia sp.]